MTNALFGDPSAAQPLPFSAFGSIPQIAPTFTAPATIDPNAVGTAPASAVGPFGQMPNSTVADPGAMGAAGVDPNAAAGFANQFEQAVAKSLQPTFQSQQQAQDEAMAARGIFNSTAAQDQQTQLQEAQGATLAGAQAPIIQAGFNAAESNAQQNAAQQQQSLAASYAAKVAAGQQTSAQEQAAYAATYGANVSGAEQTSSQAQQSGLTSYNAYEQALLANQAAANNANTYNATAANQATAGNAATQLGVTQGDQSNYNAFEQALLGYGNQLGQAGYGALLNSYSPTGSNILGAGASTAGNAAAGAAAGYNGSGLSNAISNVFAGLPNFGKTQPVGPDNGTGILQSDAQ